MLILYVVVSAGYAPPAGIDTTRIPALARDMLPAINQQLATECPELPAVPVVGEAGCGATCVDLITRYLNNVHRYVAQFTLQGSAGAVPPGIDIRAFGAPAAYTGPATGCTTPDPTTSGCLTAATAWGLTQIGTIFGGYRNGPVIKSASCWDPHLQNPTSDHPKGKACDFFPGKGGVFASGDALVH